MGYGTGRLVEQQDAFVKAMEISKAAGNIYYHIFAGSCLVSAMVHRGRLREAENFIRQMLDLAIENGIEQTGIGGSLYGNLGTILCEWNDFEEGIRMIRKGIELSELGRDPVLVAVCQIALLRALIYQMNFAGVLKVMEDLNALARDFVLPTWIANAISAFNVFGWLGGGNLDAALKWARESGLSVDDELDSQHEVEYIALAHILIAQNKLDEADRLLQRLIKNAAAGDRVYMLTEMRLWRVLTVSYTHIRAHET